MQSSYATKLIDLIESKAENIAKQWAADVMKHNRTPSYHPLRKDLVIEQGVNFYRLFRQMSLAEIPYEEAKNFSWRYAEEFYQQKIPLHEALYALILMRRHLWLYAEFQGTFVTALEKQQAVESLNRTILMFDYVSYQVTEKYQQLTVEAVNKKLGIVKTFLMGKLVGGMKNTYKIAFMAILIIAASFLTYYNHTAGQVVVFTHLFYIPIILAAIWWGKKGVLVPIILAIVLVASHSIFLTNAPFTDDIIRAVMFMVIGLVVGWLMDSVKKMEDLYEPFKS